MSLYDYVPHPHIARRKAEGPVKIADQLPQGNAMQRFNARAAVMTTKVVGSMWCAYTFGLFDLISLPDAIKGGTATIISWVAQTFLQLVLLSVIMVGQSVQSAASDKRSAQEFCDVEAILHEQSQQAAHLAAQDGKILTIADLLDVHTAGGLADVTAAVAEVHNMVAAQTMRERRR